MSTLKGLPTLAEFSAHIGATFHASCNGRSFDLRLKSTEHLIDNETQTNFAVNFVAPVDTPAQQCVYTLAQEELGPMELFLVPVARDAEGLHFEAVFNHIHSQ